MKLIAVTMMFISFVGLTGNKSDSDPSTWNNKKIEKWFSTNDWSEGWKVSPDASINKREFAISYFKNKGRWVKAFRFLKNNDLSKLETKRYDIDGDNLFATVSEYVTKNEETTNFEAHRKYIDIQYVISGNEIMNVAPINTVKDVITPYDSSKDIEFVTVGKIVKYSAGQDKFFIFFPSDAHRPGLKDGVNSPVKKIVIKLKVD
ncbi:MAG TPA: YhcH/YjgK/YiaL family protein [Bacteroidales bacterium]|nr:YhcH/YjgK/YiaL family protein [Bacteroidales bacterium]